MSSMAVIVPTRGRPHAMMQLIDTTKDITTAATRFVFAVDDDDPALRQYKNVHQKYGHGMTELIVGPRLRMVPTLNAVAIDYAVDHDIVGFMGDDHRPRTEQWDLKTMKRLEKWPGVAYGDDLWQRQNLATAVFMTSEIIRRLGYMAPEKLIHLYADNFWMLLGRETTLSFMPDVIIEHMHPDAGKAGTDAGYLEANHFTVADHDRREFDRYVREDWPRERLKLEGIA